MHPKKSKTIIKTCAKWSQYGAVIETRGLANKFASKKFHFNGAEVLYIVGMMQSSFTVSVNQWFVKNLAVYNIDNLTQREKNCQLKFKYFDQHLLKPQTFAKCEILQNLDTLLNHRCSFDPQTGLKGLKGLKGLITAQF